MARNSLYPSFIKVNYTSNGHTHRAVLPVIATPSGSTWQLQKNLGGGEYDPWTDGVDAFVLLFKALFHTADVISDAELYTLSSPTASPLFRETYAIGAAGTQSGADTAYVMTTFTTRADTGGLSRLYAMETVMTANFHARHPTGFTPADALWEFVFSSAGMIFARNGGQPTAPVFCSVKTSDALRKKFLLNT